MNNDYYVYDMMKSWVREASMTPDEREEEHKKYAISGEEFLNNLKESGCYEIDDEICKQLLKIKKMWISGDQNDTNNNCDDFTINMKVELFD